MALYHLSNDDTGRPLFRRGFRPFFGGAGVLAIVTICQWLAIDFHVVTLPLETIQPAQWHAHEMVYGYGLAVISGFLLTAVSNWTGTPTATGPRLMLLFGIWCSVRLLWVFGGNWLWITAILDLLFSILLTIAVTRPIIHTRQWQQVTVISKLWLILAFNGLFYLGALGLLSQGIYWGIYGGLYLIIGLILTMARRIVPFFIERGVGYTVTLFNSRWLDLSSTVFFIAFFFSELFMREHGWTALFAAMVCAANILRLIGWHTPGIWSKPLLWSLYLSLCAITSGFLLFAIDYYVPLPGHIAVHAMAFGGIGIITFSMMSRVTLGHTGRNVNDPPRLTTVALFLMSGGAVFRVIAPLLNTEYYSLWIALSATLWVAAFIFFSITYFPMLARPRIDGQPG